jgi:hypothetical protein
LRNGLAPRTSAKTQRLFTFSNHCCGLSVISRVAFSYSKITRISFPLPIGLLYKTCYGFDMIV